jgi:hypothetical protein
MRSSKIWKAFKIIEQASYLQYKALQLALIMSDFNSEKVQNLDDFERLKRHILALDDMPRNHPAMQAALEGLDAEAKRRKRDEKLQHKFMLVEKPTAASGSETSGGRKQENSKGAAAAQGDDSTMSGEDDWHNINDNEENENNGSYLGASLAKQVIQSMARHSDVRVTSPLASIALALHAALRGTTLGFACTGVHEPPSPGFAAPVRELPPSQLVPTVPWQNDKEIVLRYRKEGTGAMLLRVVRFNDSGKDQQVQVTLVPASTNEPSSESLVFRLGDYVNLESLQRALLQQGGGVQPALHYKALAKLLTTFAATFDLGQVRESEDLGQQQSLRVDGTLPNPPPRTQVYMQEELPFVPPYDDDTRPLSYEVPTTIDAAFPGLAVRQGNSGGDFAGDLGLSGVRGSGLQDPFRIGAPGNLMGPNHPMFGGSGVGPNSGFGMRPRYDPVGPPGGPTELDFDGMPVPPNARIPRRGGTGNPNNTLLQPPNNHNMFL